MDPKNIESALSILEIELDGLSETAELWPEQPEDWRYSLMLEWGTWMGGLRLLDREYRAGKMTRDHALRYRMVIQRLRASIPVLRQLGWVLPDVPLEEAA